MFLSYVKSRKVWLILIAILFSFNPVNYSQIKSEVNSYGKYSMNFWLGFWNVTLKDSSGAVSTGISRVTEILDNKAIYENIHLLTGPRKGYSRMSFSVYTPEKDLWYQTCIDNKGNYSNLEGKLYKDKRIFSGNSTELHNKKFKQRMVFYNLENKSFEWSREQSTNKGKTWKVISQISYTRR